MKLEAILQKLGLLQPGKIMYIGGSDVLPAPLKPEQERQAVAALEQGDEAAKQLLIEHNLRLVVYIARRFENTGVNLEDLISIGTIGLIKAVNTFRPDRNIKLATYSSRCIENEILMHIRKIANQKREVSLDEPINTDWDGNELLLSDVLGTDGDIRSIKLAIKEWLIGENYLAKDGANGRGFLETTILSPEAGIIEREKISQFGNSYKTILFPKQAQEFIFENIEEILSKDVQN